VYVGVEWCVFCVGVPVVGVLFICVIFVCVFL